VIRTNQIPLIGMPLHLCISFEQVGHLSVSSVLGNCATQVGATVVQVVERPCVVRLDTPIKTGSFLAGCFSSNDPQACMRF